MSRFVNPVPFYNDDVGRVLPNAKLYFYANGTTTPKQTFADLELTILNAQPVTADGAGNFGNIFLEAGGYRVELRDTDDVSIWIRDDINLITTSIITSAPIMYATVADIVIGNTLIGETILPNIGQTLRSQGFATFDDGRGCLYEVMPADFGAGDGAEILQLASGLQARLIDMELNSFEFAGDADNSPAYCFDPTIIMYDTPITADRTVFPSAPVLNKGYYKVVRTNNATGAFNVIVGSGGSIATLTTPGSFVEWRWNGAFFVTAGGSF